MSELRTVTLAIDPLDFDGIDRADVGQILRDALGEYLDRRGIRKSSDAGKPCTVTPAEVAPYVAERYATQPERFQRDKARNVAVKCAGAMALRRAALTIYAQSGTIDNSDLNALLETIRAKAHP